VNITPLQSASILPTMSFPSAAEPVTGRPDPASPSKVIVAGHGGLVGSAILRRLSTEPNVQIITASRSDVDLREQRAVNEWIAASRPDQIYLAAGTVGGIVANSTRPAEFLYDNTMIHANVIEAARRNDVAKLLYLGSSCIYPRLAPQPLTEEALLTGALEPTNEAYALAKIAGMKMCAAYRAQYGCDFIAAMPTNLYGPGDNFDLESSHVIPALMRKFHEARVSGQTDVVVWGSGTPMREFLHVDDLADALVHLMASYSDASHINVGTGVDVTIRELAESVRDIVHPDAHLVFDSSKPDGMPRKVLDTSRLSATGWKPTFTLAEGLATTYEWFAQHYADGELRGIDNS